MFRFFYSEEHWISYISMRFSLSQVQRLEKDGFLTGEYLIYDGSN